MFIVARMMNLLRRLFVDAMARSEERVTRRGMPQAIAKPFVRVMGGTLVFFFLVTVFVVVGVAVMILLTIRNSPQ